MNGGATGWRGGGVGLVGDVEDCEAIGLTNGVSVCIFDGLLVLFFDGRMDGVAVGTTVGILEGFAETDGCSLGFDEGEPLGLALGFDDGALLGEVDGLDDTVG